MFPVERRSKREKEGEGEIMRGIEREGRRGREKEGEGDGINN